MIPIKASEIPAQHNDKHKPYHHYHQAKARSLPCVDRLAPIFSRQRRWRCLNWLRVTRHDKIALCFYLQQLLVAGISLRECLLMLRDYLLPQRLAPLLNVLMRSLDNGQSLSQACACHHKHFDATFVALIAIAERTGRLPEILADIESSFRWQRDLSTTLQKTLFYPLLLALSLFVLFGGFLVYLIPQLLSLLQQLACAIPTSTQYLLSIANIIHHYYGVVLLSVVGAYLAGFIGYRHSQRCRYYCDRWGLQLPFIGRFWHHYLLARWARYFALLYRAGISVLDSLHLLRGLMGHAALAQALAESAQYISHGQSISHSFSHSPLFPPLVIRLLHLGEMGACLETTLNRIHQYYQQELITRSQTLHRLLQPLLLLFLGGVLAYTIVAIFEPIYFSLGQVNI